MITTNCDECKEVISEDHEDVYETGLWLSNDTYNFKIKVEVVRGRDQRNLCRNCLVNMLKVELDKDPNTPPDPKKGRRNAASQGNS